MTMTIPPVGIERRVGQRFAFNLPVSLRDVSTSTEGLGFTQDLSSRGAFLFTTMPLNEGAEIELTLRMPSEITLGDNMRVRCRGRVLRIVNAANNGWKSSFATEENFSETRSAKTSSTDNRESGEPKIGVAVCLSGYEYLPETADVTADFRRISALHGPGETKSTVSASRATPRVTAH
ncbi:MAG: type pilus assembly PilZ [Candidatus Sulfotelmatobacter sp.]|nr:type pilus assembly PilZ [Candidatus Sulfotelmatobacter sp.]